MSQSPLRRRPERPRETPNRGDPVEVTRTNDDMVLGVVASLLDVPGATNVCVDTGDGELVTVAERVAVVTGVDAKLARQATEGEDV